MVFLAGLFRGETIDSNSADAGGRQDSHQQGRQHMQAHQPAQPAHQVGQRRPHYTGVLLGGTGQGKSTLVNLMVNFFRAPIELRKRLPSARQLRVAIPTQYLEATEPEGAQAREKNATDRKPLSLPRVAHLIFL